MILYYLLVEHIFYLYYPLLPGGQYLLLAKTDATVRRCLYVTQRGATCASHTVGSSLASFKLDLCLG